MTKRSFQSELYTEDIQDIITTPPRWLIRWGAFLSFAIIMMLLFISSMIRYPEIIKTRLKIISSNSPKAVVAKSSGKLVKLLVKENQEVTRGAALAYLESIADHSEVMDLLKDLKELQAQIHNDESNALKILNKPNKLPLGEVQSAYENFYGSYLAYLESADGGLLPTRRQFLIRGLESILKQKGYLLLQKEVQEADYVLAKQEYEMHQKLAEQKVVAIVELKREESKFLAKKLPLQQTETALIGNSSQYSEKKKEILEIDNQIVNEKAKFVQALNSLISEIDNWKTKYLLIAPVSGRVNFGGIIQENQFIDLNQEVFYVNPGNTNFFGQLDIPQYNMGKIEEGQEVLVKLESFPYEEYGIIRGKIGYISDAPIKDSVFVSKVNFDKHSFSKLSRPVRLKDGMIANVEIITEEATLLNRLFRNINKLVNVQ